MSEGTAVRRLDILGCPVDPVREDQAVEWLHSCLSSPASGCRHLITLNPEYVMTARRDRAFAEAVRRADMVTADGVGIVLAARWLAPGTSPDRITGVDLVERLAGIDGARHFLLGGGPGIAERAAARLRSRFPAFTLAGTWDGGSPGHADDDGAMARIRLSGATVVLVAYGAPGQITWIARNQQVLGEAGVRLAIGVGGAFDYLAGEVPRAPRWVRRAGLEWCYRLFREPWRWRRQRVLPVFSWLVLLDGIRQRMKRLPRKLV